MSVFVRRVMIAAMLLSWLAGVGPARAGGIAVTTTVDSLLVDGECSLREAVLAANTGVLVDTCDGREASLEILLQPGLVYQLSLQGPDGPEAGDLDILAGMALTGDPANPAIISAKELGDRVLHINSDAPVALTGLEIRGGTALVDPYRGGGIYIEKGTAILNAVIVAGNTSGNVGGGIFVNRDTTVNIEGSIIRGNQAVYGGGIFSYGRLTVTSSSLFDNAASNSAGGLYNGALVDGFALLVNTTVARNSVPASATNRSAGIYAAGKLELKNVTIIDNAGAGLQITTKEYADKSIIRNSIIARHPADGNCRLPLVGDPLKGRRNLADDATCRLDPVLDAEVPPAFVGVAAEPANFGTLTLMYDLLWNSPANNLGVDCAATDQRGMARAARCDLGAVERDGPDPFSTWMAAANR